MSPSGKSAARDAALRRVSRAKRWVIAGAIGLTGVFSAVASQAFPGRSLKATTTTTTAPAPATSAPAPPDDNSPPDQSQVPDQSGQDSAIPPPQSIPQPSDSGGGAVSGGS
jgi:hypothetical protein